MNNRKSSFLRRVLGQVTKWRESSSLKASSMAGQSISTLRDKQSCAPFLLGFYQSITGRYCGQCNSSVAAALSVNMPCFSPAGGEDPHPMDST